MGLRAQKATPSRDFNAMIIETDGAVLGEGAEKHLSRRVAAVKKWGADRTRQNAGTIGRLWELEGTAKP